MICLFYWRAYNNFAKIVMLHRELTEEEANQLFESALLLISQQNQAEKQRLSKPRTAPSPSLHSLSPRSPPRPKRRDSHHHSPEPLLLDSHLDLSPPKPIQLTTHKFPSEKSDSLPQLQPQSPDEDPMQPEEPQHSPQVVLVRECENSGEMEGECGAANAGQQLFLESEIKEVKRDLQIRSRGKVCKTQEINSSTGQVTGYHFYCKNDSECGFDCCLEYAGRRSAKGEKYYRLVVVSETHLPNCLEEEEEICFMKLTKLIDSMEQPIVKLLEANGELKPKEILTLMASDFGEESHKFIYKGLESKNYHKAAKKYFDNLIYKVKNGMGVL